LPRTIKTAGAKDSSVARKRKKFSPPAVTAQLETRAELDAVEKAARRAAHLAAIAKFGPGRLPINPATGKRWFGTGKYPKSGISSPILRPQSDLPPVHFAGRYRSRRERAAELRERMACFSTIYNAGWLVRDAQSGPTQRLDEAMMRFVAVLLQEMRTCRDFEALIYAVADTITCSRHGVPWEE
jgi:hypothetical protein